MNITIGIVKSNHELIVSTDKSLDELTALVNQAFESGMLIVDDVKNGRFVVPSKRIAYVNIAERRSNSIGFTS